jgi:hypothetical protein
VSLWRCCPAPRRRGGARSSARTSSEWGRERPASFDACRVGDDTLEGEVAPGLDRVGPIYV